MSNVFSSGGNSNVSLPIVIGDMWSVSRITSPSLRVNLNTDLTLAWVERSNE
jgi:hypothetical protein